MTARVENGMAGIPAQEVGARVTREDLSTFVPNYHSVLHERLYSTGILKEGVTLDLIFPSIPHDNSDAEYIYEGTIGNDWIFVYFMGPNKKTSSHKHPYEGVEIEEDYHLLRGKMFLQLGKDEDGVSQVELTEDSNFTTVPPNTLHGGSTDGHFAFVLVRMRGAASIPRDQLHIPV